MTDPANLIARARAAVADGGRFVATSGGLLDALADALEAAEAENERLRHGPLRDDETTRCTAGHIRQIIEEAEEAQARAERAEADRDRLLEAITPVADMSVQTLRSGGHPPGLVCVRENAARDVIAAVEEVTRA